ncbi:hypothetical protein HFN_2240 [Helicobacter fennelliae MRY12-0050]|uniref:Uncharacterized protein n=1 Tax=Helicobacter fennelliae MRY12-0050 TaxID=1325130 RepID=T1DVK7_9HELI|nr:hypothetical protein HFN_2240 [Helicobacter fennelliae MRY12-0050]
MINCEVLSKEIRLIAYRRSKKQTHSLKSLKSQDLDSRI